MSDNCVLLVRQNVSPGLPHAIYNQLFAEARKLLREGISADTLKAALREWDGRPGMGPGMLPHLVSDVVRGHRAPIKNAPDWETKLQKELDA